MNNTLKLILISVCLVLFALSTFISIKLRKSINNNQLQEKKSIVPYLTMLSIVLVILTVLTVYLVFIKK